MGVERNLQGRRRDFGLGSYATVSLKEARSKALEYLRIPGREATLLLLDLRFRLSSRLRRRSFNFTAPNGTRRQIRGSVAVFLR